MAVLREKGTQKSSRNIILRAAVYDTVIKVTVIPIQDIKEECMALLNQKKVRLVNYETSMRNHDYISVIYLTAAKVLQCRLVAGNRE